MEGLIGPNGAGKSTLMGLLTRRIGATTGTINFEVSGKNHDLCEKQSFEVAQLGLIKTNQRIQNFESLTIRESLRLAATPAENESLVSWFKKPAADAATSAEDIESRVDHYLDKFTFADPDGYAKSAGEKKLLDILRCLIFKPRMLLMDEPTAGLPEDVTRQVMDEIAEQSRNNKMRIVVVEHDLELIWSVCEYVHFLSDGEMLFQGTPDEVKSNHFVAEKYLGVS